MIGELGHLALILAFVVATIQGVVPLLGAWRRIPAWTAVAVSAARAQFLLIGISYLCLTHLFIVSDFSFTYVAQNSNTALPLFYKISAVWGAHEGSMLLWAAILAGWGFAVATLSASLPDTFRARVLAVVALVSVGFHLFMLLTSNPFERLLSRAGAGTRSQPPAPGPRHGRASALLYMGTSASWCLRLCGGGPAGGPHRSRMDALDPAVDHRRLGVPHLRDHGSGAGGRTASSGGAAGGSGIRWRTPRSCRGWSPPR